MTPSQNLTPLTDATDAPQPRTKAPSGKGKNRTLLYVLVILVAGGAAAYFAFFNGESGPAPDPAAQNRAAEIQASATGATPPPELPVDKRPPRGARPAAK